MYQIDLDIQQKDLEKLDVKSKEFRKGLFKGVRKALFMAEANAKGNFGGQGQLNVRTGHLRRSITSDIKEGSGSIMGIVSSNVIYAAVHEKGLLHPRSKTIHMTKRPFISPAFNDDNLREYKDVIQKTVKAETI